MSDVTREEVDAKLTAVKAEVYARLADFEGIVKTGFAELRAEMAVLRAEMRAEMHKNTADLIKWAIGLAIAVVGLTVGLLTYFSKAPQPQPAPIIITIPGGAGVAPAPVPPK